MSDTVNFLEQKTDMPYKNMCTFPDDLEYFKETENNVLNLFMNLYKKKKRKEKKRKKKKVITKCLFLV